MPRAWLMCCAVGFAPAAWADPVTFADAIARASADAPSVVASRAGLEAARLSIDPAGELPDPQLALGVQNLPVTGADRFELDRDFMTMKSVGVMQEVPSRDKRGARTDIAKAEAGLARAALDVTRLEARLEAARAWIDAFYGAAELEVLGQLASELASLSDAATSAFSSGAGSSDAALTARIARSRIDDRLSDIRARVSVARAELARWIGPLNQESVGPVAPSFEIEPGRLRQHVERHVMVLAAVAGIERARADTELARAERKSDWSWELMYQSREPAFSDMISVGVRFSLPLFQSARQSPRIAARRAEVSKTEAEREAAIRQARAHLETMLAEHGTANDRLARLRDVQLPLARQRQDLAEAGLSAGDRPVADLINARAALLEMELERIGLERQVALLGAMLTLEHGEPTP